MADTKPTPSEEYAFLIRQESSRWSDINELLIRLDLMLRGIGSKHQDIAFKLDLYFLQRQLDEATHFSKEIANLHYKTVGEMDAESGLAASGPGPETPVH